MKYLSQSADETKDLGQKLGHKLNGGEFIILIGDLGGGKTQFTKGLAKGLRIEETITSPTFVLERIYDSPKKLTLHHFDFYRLPTYDAEIEADVESLREDPKNIIIIEWAKNMPGAIPAECLEITFYYTGNDTREINLEAKGDKYKKLIEGLE